MRRILFLALVFVFNSSIKSQEFKVGLLSGLGRYKMSSLKDLNDFVLFKSSIIESKCISNFPAYYYYQPTLILSFKRISFGLMHGQYSTGSRISTRDYSGEYRFDCKIKSGGTGFIGQINLNPNDKLNFNFYMVYGSLSTHLTLSEFFIILDEKIIDNQYKYKANNRFLEYGFKLSYPILFMCLEINLGYFNQYDKTHFKGDEQPILLTYGKEAKPDWSGLRMGISVFFTVPVKYFERQTNISITPPSTP